MRVEVREVEAIAARWSSVLEQSGRVSDVS